MGWAPEQPSTTAGAGGGTSEPAKDPSTSEAKTAGNKAAQPTQPSGTKPPPTTDRDGDGVLDANDKCPDLPEDKDGFEDSDGCPESDNDGDGVIDAQDRCPSESARTPDGCPAAGAK